ncbi:MAG: SUMF1/EgtB/PvdO family nonheme iron enzyme, partial [Planctomycetota bacterium]
MTLTTPRFRTRWGFLPAFLLLTALCVFAQEKDGEKGSAEKAGSKLLGTASTFAGMVEIPAGEFEMGVDEKFFVKTFNMKSKKRCHPRLKGKEKDNWWPILLTETPEHDAETEAYAIDRYEVTNAQYKVFLDETSQESVFTTKKKHTLTAVAT